MTHQDEGHYRRLGRQHHRKPHVGVRFREATAGTAACTAHRVLKTTARLQDLPKGDPGVRQGRASASGTDMLQPCCIVLPLCTNLHPHPVALDAGSSVRRFVAALP